VVQKEAARLSKVDEARTLVATSSTATLSTISQVCSFPRKEDELSDLQRGYFLKQIDGLCPATLYEIERSAHGFVHF